MRVSIIALLVAWAGCVTTTPRKLTFDTQGLTAQSSEEYYVNGTLDLTVELKNPNPICASYQLKLTSATYTPQPALSALSPATPIGSSGLIAPLVNDCSSQSGASRAHCEIRMASEQAQALSKAQGKISDYQGDLSNVWAMCDAPSAPGELANQSVKITNLKVVYDKKLDMIIANASEAGARAFAAARALKAEAVALGARLPPLRTAAQLARERLDEAVKANAGPQIIEKRRAEFEAAQQPLDAGQAQFEGLDKLAGVVGDWGDQLVKAHAPAKASLDALRADVAATLALVPVSDQNSTVVLARQTVEPNQLVTVEVVETKRSGGKLVEKGGDRSLGVVSMAVLRPLRLDVGIGPAVSFAWKRAYGVGDDKTIIETERTPDIDGLLALSAYYTPRYLNGKSFRPVSVIPRPMIGLSLRDPLSAIYAGVQLDPIQFLDISFGAKIHARTELAAAQLGDMAALDAEGKAIPPTTRSKVGVDFFVSISASTALFTSWISALTK